MRLSASLMIIALLALIVSEARAQESSIPLNVEAAAAEPQRTPALVIHEVVAVARADKSAPVVAPKTQGVQTKNAASKLLAAGAPSVPSSSPLIVVPAASVSGMSELQTTGNPKYDEFIAQSAARNGVDPNLIIAVMRQESGFNLRARSYKGATGLMQLMPATAQRFGVTNIWDAGQNIEGGARYLRFLLDSFNGDVKLALAGYNAGEHAVVNSGFRVPRYRETQNYVRSISARYEAGKYTTKRTASSSQAAPTATVFLGGAASTRLSNNY
jgi:soluble lytic murein transglycosylase-like protein